MLSKQEEPKLNIKKADIADELKEKLEASRTNIICDIVYRFACQNVVAQQ